MGEPSNGLKWEDEEREGHGMGGVGTSRPRTVLKRRNGIESPMNMLDLVILKIKGLEEQRLTEKVLKLRRSKFSRKAPVAQWIERLFPKQKVVGSTPTWRVL